MKFFKALIPDKDDSEKSCESNSNIISFGLICLKALINRICDGDFPKS